ncbi:unnamed protein product, partial [marine sediment metagenome]
VFDGDWHIISNLSIDTQGQSISYLGLFGYITNAKIENLGIEDISILGGENCNYVGGLVGKKNGGAIANCYSTGSIQCGRYSNKLGGLAGRQSGGSIEKSYTIFTIQTETDCSSAGGIVGYLSFGSVVNCYSKVSLQPKTNTNWVGGIAGISWGVIENCYTVCDLSGSSFFSWGAIVGQNAKSTGAGGRIYNCFWDTVVSPGLNGFGTNYSTTPIVNLQGLPTDQMQQIAAYVDVGWDFIDETVNGANDIWEICDGTNYPKLAWQIPLLGDFVCPDGVEINDLAVLVEQWLLEKLSADISPDGGDGFVDFADWAVFANAWQSTSEPQSANWNPKCDIAPAGGDGIVDMDDLTVFVSQWLQFSAYCADIAPEPDGDGLVNMLDFAMLAEYWLEGNSVSLAGKL